MALTTVTLLQQAMTVRAHYDKEKNSVLDKGLQMVREQCSAGKPTTHVRHVQPAYVRTSAYLRACVRTTYARRNRDV